MTREQRNLLDLLADLNRLENRCQHLQTSFAVPSVVYDLINKLRNEIAKWGTEAICKGGDST